MTHLISSPSLRKRFKLEEDVGVVGVGVEGEASAAALRLKFAKPLDRGVDVAGAVKDGMRKG